MTSYNDNDTTYNHEDYPVQYTIQLYLRLYSDDIQEDERDYITPITDYCKGKYTFKNGRWQGGNYILVVKTDGSEDGTSACFSHNHKTEEIKVETTCHEHDYEEKVQYKAVISLPPLIEDAFDSLYEGADQVITANRARGLQVWVEFTERGWKVEFSNTHISSQEEIDRRLEEEQEELWREYMADGGQQDYERWRQFMAAQGREEDQLTIEHYRRFW